MFRFLTFSFFTLIVAFSTLVEAQEVQALEACEATAPCNFALSTSNSADGFEAYKGKGPRGVVGKGIKGAGGAKTKPLGKKSSVGANVKGTPPGKKATAKATKTTKSLVKQKIATKPKVQKNPNSAGAASKLWGKGREKTRLDNANAHWKKHKNEFPQHKTAAQYAKAAANFTRNPPKGTNTFRRKNGDTMYYHRKSNTYAVAAANGSVKTYFRPKEKQKYWRQQLKEHGR